MNVRKAMAQNVKKGMVLNIRGVGRALVSSSDTSSGTTVISLVGRSPLVYHPTHKVTVIDPPKEGQS